MIKIAICDDDGQELALAHELVTKYASRHLGYEIKISTFSAPLELLANIDEQGRFDVLLLDVYMSGMLGTDAARELRHLGDEVEIIFLTNSRDHSLDAFEVDAAQYLVKPYGEQKLFAALDKIMGGKLVDNRVVVTLKTIDGIMRLAPRDVVFAETGRNNYQIIHTIHGKTMEVRMTASELFELLSQNKYFLRCGVSLSVNLKYIRQISKDVIIFDTGECLPYPYRVYQKLKEEFLRFQMSAED